MGASRLCSLLWPALDPGLVQVDPLWETLALGTTARSCTDRRLPACGLDSESLIGPTPWRRSIRSLLGVFTLSGFHLLLPEPIPVPGER